ncbi:RluA family pseudouridine synthase [Halodesulfovibrio marinisediminis]|uniref:tRNA pseudouridine32 synthase / 23S rRNA pseudouridine746 synthase n=1 Tax=Halodesulfovibrio marinisediminis DSM 17456 TaxID=1121457 RepID=A0A1N6FBM9_9BACT|nr:RluA family pseudouridine synthase [Halodesulfovibrio marinisediminis]SIN92695.1 tRNA pseudouridine32 synthase / 23S rRNA pseudouridine746 synthase [Halodesulfovibrio marinisediminis DSM 17456]
MNSLSFVYEDTKLVVVNKPSGLLSVPGKGEENQDSVETRIRERFPACTKIPTVHRLDMDTSGLLVFALTKRAKRELSDQFQQREVSKRYVALIEGLISEEGGTISLPLRMDLDNRPYSIVDHDNGRPALTEWRNLGVEGSNTRVEFVLHTGRTHQLRLHALHGLGFPIVGDRLYGNGTQAGQMKLHAAYLRFMHPKTKEMMEFHSEPDF